MQNRRRLFVSKLAIQVQLMILYILGSIWENQQPPTVFLHDAKNHKYQVGQRCDTTHTTEAPPSINLLSSRKFWCSLMVSNPCPFV